MRSRIEQYPHFFLSFFSLLFLSVFIGKVHLFDWDEVNFATIAKEMLLSNHWSKITVDYLPFTDKPPLFFWMQALSMKLFGVNEWAARFPNVLAGIATLNLIFFLGKKYHGIETAKLWVLVYLGCFTSQIYFRSGIIDPWFNFFIYCSLFFFYKSIVSKRKSLFFLLVGVLLALAFLTKGPVSILVIGLVGLLYWMGNKFKLFFKPHHLLFILFPIFLAIGSWYGFGQEGSPSKALWNFINIQKALFSKNVANHAQPFYYHPVILLFGMFPASILAFLPLLKRKWLNESEVLGQLFRIFFWVVLILFSIVKTKIVHYSSMTYLPITYFAALRLKNLSLNKIEKNLLWIVGTLLCISLASLAIIGNNVWESKSFLISNINNPITIQGLLLDGGWTQMELYISTIFSLGLLTTLYTNKIKYLFLWISLFCPALLISFAPKIEAHSQKVLVDFHQSHAKEDAYFISHSFASYVPNFYARNHPYQNSDKLLAERKSILKNLSCHSYSDLPLEKRAHFSNKIWHWCLCGDIDKTVYVSILKKHQHKMDAYPKLIFLYEKGPYAFYTRPIP